MNHDDERDFEEEEANREAMLHEALLEHEAMCYICGFEYPLHTDTAHEPVWGWGDGP